WLLSSVLLVPCAARADEPVLDLTTAIIVTPPGLSGPENKAVAMLAEEVQKRTLIRWKRQEDWPAEPAPVVIVGPAAALRKLPTADPSKLPPDGPREGYRIWTDRGRASPIVWVAGKDSRGVLFGVGRLLRALIMERRRVTLRADFETTSAPQTPLRG